MGSAQFSTPPKFSDLYTPDRMPRGPTYRLCRVVLLAELVGPRRREAKQEVVCERPRAGHSEQLGELPEVLGRLDHNRRVRAEIVAGDGRHDRAEVAEPVDLNERLTVEYERVLSPIA